ncbi:hypothetical protein HYE68_005367 [Fusarium pseudograminearum]|nr:hypothetical protein HYE68_005367 [Fusarium pseudograminearum]
MATPAMSPILISTLPDLLSFISSISQSSTLYLDLEGNNLSRNGNLTIITVLIHPTRVTGLIDVQTLGNSAFTTPTSSGNTLKSILEDTRTTKRLWDVRNDADALWAHHQIRLAGVTDIQLLENASRAGDKTYVRGLDICVEKDLGLNAMEVQRWTRTKREVKALMQNDIFARRPLDAKTMQYCVNDVLYLPALYSAYAKRTDGQWMKKVMDESARRVVDACGPSYEPQSKAKKLGPWGAGSGSGSGKRVLTLEEALDRWDDQRVDEMERELLGRGDMDDASYWSNY